ncbi:ribosomal protein S17 [Thraustotheca clavata]|uniref:Small ribosomal subunit protein uS17c n=1 Tax=Thraustotheca clavata TaxID=74557 RepID=A0A1W0A9Z1_9STRA|nr:ribosomal protein S17 [Thraustotheca clavata]
MKPIFGKIVSDKMQKSVLVAVTRIVKDPKFGKYYKKTKKFMAHDEENVCGMGDMVRLAQTRPLSKKKRWNRLLQMCCFDIGMRFGLEKLQNIV